MGELSKLIIGVFVVVFVMLGTFTFIGGFSEHYNLTETQEYAEDKGSSFENLSAKIYNYSQGTQTAVQNVTASGGQESNLLAGLWVIPQALTILSTIPEIILVSVDTLTHLGDASGMPVPDWVPIMLYAIIIALTFLAIGSIVWKYPI